MEIHELNTKSMTSPAYCALDDGSDTYKLDLNAVLDNMDSDIESDIAAVDTKVQKKTRIWYATVSSQTGTPSITITGFAPGDNDYLMLLFQFGNTSIKDVIIGSTTYEIWYKGANTAVKADGGERVLYRIKNVTPYRLEYVGNHYDLATTSAKGLMSAADKAALDQAVSDVSDIQEELLIKANKVGSAPDLIAGLSENFNTSEGTTIEEPYNLKVSGGNGREKLKQIVGVSVGWNQLWDGGKAVVSSIATITDLGNHAYELESVATGDQPYRYGVQSETKVQQVAGRKWLFSAVITPTFDSTNYSLFIGTQTVTFQKTVQANQTVEIARIQQINYDANNYLVFHTRDMKDQAVGASCVIKNLMCIDLTIALGSTIADYVLSLETATAGAGVAWLKSRFPKMFGQYNPYDAGSIKSVTGLSAHVMRNADDEIIGTYPLDDSLTLRGILKLDANNQPYADGDTYEADGTVTRNYAERAYQAGDESLPDAITNGTTTVYKLTTPTAETAEPYTESQIVDGYGTEEFVSTSIVPVGNETFYLADLKGKLEDLPTIPEAPATNGTYVLKATVSGGVATYSWVSE